MPTVLSNRVHVRPRAWAVLLVIAAASACKREAPRGEVAPSSVRRGDRVVVEAAAARFFEAQVLEVKGDQLRVQSAELRESVLVSASDVYRLPAPSREVHPGDPAICNATAGTWVACQVLAVDAHGIDVQLLEGDRRRLDRTVVLAPTDLTAMNLRRSFERSSARAAFRTAVMRAGRPHAPAGWKPSPRQRVLGLRDPVWYSATIHEIDDDQIFVRWDVDGRISELGPSDVAPEPPYEPPPAHGQYVLVRPPASGQPWKPVRIESVDADVWVVVDVDGERRTVAARDLVPLR
jgi:hypothetical protein